MLDSVLRIHIVQSKILRDKVYSAKMESDPYPGVTNRLCLLQILLSSVLYIPHLDSSFSFLFNKHATLENRLKTKLTVATTLQDVDKDKWTYEVFAFPSTTLVNVVVALVPFGIPSRMKGLHLHHSMHSQHRLSARKFSKHAVLFIIQQENRYSVLPFSTQIAIRSDITNQRIALGNGRSKSLLLPRILLRYVLDSRETEHRLPILQVVASQEVDRRTRVIIYEGWVIRHLVTITS